MTKKILILLTLMVSAAVFAAPPAPQRFAVVRMADIFRQYYRSKIAEEELTRQSDIYRNYLAERNRELKKMEQEIAALREEAQNVALTDEYRRERQAACTAKEQELAEKTAELRRYARERAARLRELEQKRREEIIADIRNAVSRKAAAEKYDFVFDVSGNTTNNIPPVLVWPQSVDLTDTVLATLNAAATDPAPAAASPAPATGEKP
ncbi:MAG: OmpH family outer membrane protein [Lentisphaeria bacterium]|nr:OmpH family outer membrane protein [Lentisphaeria bacterium]